MDGLEAALFSLREQRRENSRLRYSLRLATEKLEILRGQNSAQDLERRAEKKAERKTDFRARVLRELKDGREMSLTEISRKTKNLDSRERRSFLREMIEEGLIKSERGQEAARGARATKYRLAGGIQGAHSLSVNVSLSVGSQWQSIEEIADSADLLASAKNVLDGLCEEGEIDYKDRATAAGRTRLYRARSED